MPRYTYIGPSYNPSVGINIPEAAYWGGTTTNDVNGIGIFLRTLTDFFLFPLTMSDADITAFLAQYPNYAGWWIDTQSGNLTIQEHYFTITPSLPSFTVTAFAVSDSDPNIMVFLGKLKQNKGINRDYTIGAGNVITWSYTPLEEYQGVVLKLTL